MLLQELRSPQVAALPRDMPVLLPIASLEQHGAHMPVFTDSLLCGEVVRRVSEAAEREVLVAPLLWLGSSDHHLDFPGTVSAPARAYLDVLGGVLESLIGQGFRRLVLLNGHGGNTVPARQAMFEVRQRHRRREDLLLLAAPYWGLGGKPWEADPTIRQRRMGHACEWETSMMLRLAPHLVGEFRDAEPVPFADAFDPADRGMTTRDESRPGHVGDPRTASAEKGETLFRVFTEHAIAFLRRVAAWDGRAWR